MDTRSLFPTKLPNLSTCYTVEACEYTWGFLGLREWAGNPYLYRTSQSWSQVQHYMFE